MILAGVVLKVAATGGLTLTILVKLKAHPSLVPLSVRVNVVDVHIVFAITVTVAPVPEPLIVPAPDIDQE